jgi:hypothetical protein
MARAAARVLSEIGLHPSLIVLGVTTAEGVEEEISLDRRSFSAADGGIDIGWPVGQREDGALLVEFPQETSRGAWRLWVPAASVSGLAHP